MVRPKKHLGQHFLRDDNIARKIVGYLSPEALNVLEIGPGTGILTKYLIHSVAYNYLAIEIDNESIEYLKNHFPEYSEKFILADFLKVDLEELIHDKVLIIGNFPYNISSQILFKILENRNKVTDVIGMFQKEVGERISSSSGSKKYGILSVLVQAYFKIDYLFTVNENVFYPPPNVKSAVIMLKRNQVKVLDCNEKLFFEIVKAGFNQRRKTLRNSLRKYSFPESGKIIALLNKRAEQLDVGDFVFLTQNAINNQVNPENT
jgi:16S rRNA (adenine1518-N6/adenine1519-N6)-dimethyltransferase